MMYSGVILVDEPRDCVERFVRERSVNVLCDYLPTKAWINLISGGVVL